MKYALGILLLVMGLAALSLSFAVRSQLHTLATQAAAPNLADYPLLMRVAPPPIAGEKPATWAARVSSRIYAMAGVGGVFLLLGAIAFVLKGQPKVPKPDD